MSQHQHIQQIMHQSMDAFSAFRKPDFTVRLTLAEKISELLNADRDKLIHSAAEETHISKERLSQELDRSINQFLQYAQSYKKGNWLIPRIDVGKKDLRKTWVPIGPVVVYGASNFPFAYSTPGGDVASALAAGCTVVVKAHPAHLNTSKLCANIIQQALHELKLHPHIFQHIVLEDQQDGKVLIQHPYTAAVGFTGSLNGGKQLFDWANERKKPIPVFCEMGSLNPMFLFKEELARDYIGWAKKISSSITNSAGQFCTKPGLIFGLQSCEWESFKEAFAIQLEEMQPTQLLHPGILSSFRNKTETFRNLTFTHTLRNGKVSQEGITATLMEVSAKAFLESDILQEEVFGPFTLLITCESEKEFYSIAEQLNGALTSSVIASRNELLLNVDLIEKLQQICGRLIFNDVPTGVIVANAMNHGGPYPASTDSRFTAVGADAILRFVRPVTYQNCMDTLLPEELKNENKLGLWRQINGELTRDSI